MQRSRLRLTKNDVDFVVDSIATQAKDKERLRHLFLEDPRARKAFTSDERVFHRINNNDEAFVRISPHLFFEILLRRTAEELKTSSHTLERSGSQKVAVFDNDQAVGLLSRYGVLEYLADMLASFTRIRSHVTRIRVRKGIWRRIRFNDMDIDGLTRLCANADHEQRFGLYKRIADVCLFTLGIFPEYAQFDYRYPSSKRVRPNVSGAVRRGMEDYEIEGRQTYGLAAQHEAAIELGLHQVLLTLSDQFNAAKKPLSFLSEHYLRFKRQRLFGMDPE